MYKLFDTSIKKKLVVCVLVLAIIFSLSKNSLDRFYIIAKFTESGPLYKNMPVYYKGCKIGKISNVTINEDYEYTRVKMTLYPKEPKLSENTEAYVKYSESKNDYIDLVSSDSSSNMLLAKGSMINGVPEFDIQSFMAEIADADLIVPLLETFTDTLESFSKTSYEIRLLASDSRLVLNDNRQNLKQISRNLKSTSGYLSTFSNKLNKSVEKDELDVIVSNVNKSSTSIKNITENIDNSTKNLNKTMLNIDSAISDASIAASNTKIITRGLCNSLSKRFAGFRILFGKPIKHNSCSNKCR